MHTHREFRACFKCNIYHVTVLGWLKEEDEEEEEDQEEEERKNFFFLEQFWVSTVSGLSL